MFTNSAKPPRLRGKRLRARLQAPLVMPKFLAGARDSHFNSGLQVKLQRKIRQGAIRPEASLDLHGYRQI